jgi:hypothetical protein
LFDKKGIIVGKITITGARGGKKPKIKKDFQTVDDSL